MLNPPNAATTLGRIHLVDILAFYHKVCKKKVLTVQQFCRYLKDTLTDADLEYLAKNNWYIECVGRPTQVSPGAKKYHVIAPYYMRFAEHNNCYSFAVDDLRGFRYEKAVPGVIANNKRRNKTLWQECKVPTELVVKDSLITRSITRAHANNVGNPGTYLVQFYVDQDLEHPYDSTDFHWYREVRPPAWLNHYIKYNRDYHDTRNNVTNKINIGLFMKQVKELLPKTERRGIKLFPEDATESRLKQYHGIQGYFTRKDMGHHDSDRGVFAVYANKAGNSDILTICSCKGKIMLNPLNVERGYSPEHDYDKFCAIFVVKTNMGRSSV